MNIGKLSTLCIFSVFFLLFAAVPARAAYSNIKVNVSDTDFIVGENFTASIYVDLNSTEEVNGVSVDHLSFNPAVLNVTDVTFGNIFSDAGGFLVSDSGTVYNDAGNITYIYGTADTLTSTSGIFVNVTFKVVGEGTSDIKLIEAKLSDGESPDPPPYYNRINATVSAILNYLPEPELGFNFSRWNGTYGIPLDVELPFVFRDRNDLSLGFQARNQTGCTLANLTDVPNGTEQNISFSLDYGLNQAKFIVLDNYGNFTFDRELHLYGPAWDMDGNSDIDVTDVSIVSSDYGLSGLSKPYEQLPSDVDANGGVDLSDVSIPSLHYGELY